MRDLGEFDAVDDVAAIGRQRHVALLLDIRRTRLGELAGDAADLDDRQLRPEGQYDGHLQEGAEEVADIVGAVFGEALGAIAALQQETVAFGDIGEMLLQAACFTCKNERRIAGKRGFRCRQSGCVGIIRNLQDRFLPPAARGPIFCHLTHLFLHPYLRMSSICGGL